MYILGFKKVCTAISKRTDKKILLWRHNNHCNDFQPNDTKHKDLIYNTQDKLTTLCPFVEFRYARCNVLLVVMLNVIMLSIFMLGAFMLSVVVPLLQHRYSMELFRLLKLRFHNRFHNRQAHFKVACFVNKKTF